MAKRKPPGHPRNRILEPPKKTLSIWWLTGAAVLVMFAIGLYWWWPRQTDYPPIDNSPAPATSQEGLPRVTIEMSYGGKIYLELYPEIAPNTVANFISLANAGFYDNVIFHRVIPGFMIQGGDPKGDGTGGPDYRIPGEFTANGHPNPLSHERGVISMARQGHPTLDHQFYDTAGSQFFIMVAKAPTLDGKYAAFGRVLRGMEIVDWIVEQPRDQRDRPNSPPRIRTIRVETFGREYPEPTKTGQ